MIDAGVLVSLKVNEAIISYSPQKQVWLPEPDRFNIEDARKEFPDLAEDDIIKINNNIRKYRDEHDEKRAKDLGRKIIGKFTHGGSYGYKRHCTRLIMDDAELDFIIADTTEKNTFINRSNAYLSDGTKLGTIVSCIEGDSPQFTHLRSSMLSYVSINLLSMINRFPRYAVRVATDSFYINKKYKDLLKPLLGNGECGDVEDKARKYTQLF